jgi:hypothetical protein
MMIFGCGRVPSVLGSKPRITAPNDSFGAFAEAVSQWSSESDLLVPKHKQR